MKQFVYSIIASLCLVIIVISCSSKQSEGGLLWKISGKGLTEPSYLFGTFHGGPPELRNASFLDSVYGFHKAFNSVSQFMCETDFSGRGVELSQKSFMPKDTTYADVLSHSGLQILDSILLKHMRVTSDNMRQRPEELRYLIVMLHNDWIVGERIDKKRELFFKENGGGVVSGEKLDEVDKINMERYIMDTQLLFKARENSLDILPGLDNRIGFDLVERREYQPLENAAQELDSFLVRFISTPDMSNRVGDRVRDAYRSQDIVAFEQACQELDAQSKVPKEYHAMLGADRNVAWMEYIPQIMKEKSTFIAVGARHLIGEEGLLKLLENEDYIVEPVLENKFQLFVR